MESIILKKNNPGFTLAEMLVTVGVFAIAMSVSSSIFINVNNLQQQTANMGKLQNEGRYVLEKISKEIRGRELDYASTLLSATGTTDILVFKKDELGDVYKIFFDHASSSIDVETDNVDTGIAKTAHLSSDEIIADRLEFKISPVTDPYEVGALNPPLEQPRVTMVMLIKNRNVPDKYKKTLLLQTTISSKIYH